MLIKCPECKKEISDTAVSCPNCGWVLTKMPVREPPNVMAEMLARLRKNVPKCPTCGSTKCEKISLPIFNTYWCKNCGAAW
jgi:predicted RNA-binding Zn-ribbon protein involved in translation (DUF1610 family)